MNIAQLYTKHISDKPIDLHWFMLEYGLSIYIPHPDEFIRNLEQLERQKNREKAYAWIMQNSKINNLKKNSMSDLEQEADSQNKKQSNLELFEKVRILRAENDLIRLEKENSILKNSDKEMEPIPIPSRFMPDMNEQCNGMPVESEHMPDNLLYNFHKFIKQSNGQTFGLISQISRSLNQILPFDTNERPDNDIDSFAANSFAEALNMEKQVTISNIDSLQRIADHLKEII